MANTKKQNSKQKRIMVASVLIAATIALGGTFAWLTSTDSVTNRLTASADYGVSIVEDFTPPEDWVPGQIINKDVRAVNTGNVSASVKLTLSNALTVSYEEVNESGSNDGKEFVKLSADKGENAVLAAQQGGYLVAAYDTNGKAISGVTLGKVGTKYNVYGTDDQGNATLTKPEAAGTYIFRSEDTTKDAWTYDGFYYDGTDYYKIKVTCETQPTYGDGDTVKDEDTDGIADSGAFTVKRVIKTTVKSEKPTFTYDSTSNQIKAVYDRGDADTKNDITIYIHLKNVSTAAGDYWTYGGLNEDGTKAYFYLNKLLEQGTTSSDLIDSVELSSEIETGAYVDLTYDLNVDLDSIQAVYSQTDAGKTTINEDQTASAAKNNLLNEFGTGDYAFNTVTVTAGSEDSNGNIESGDVSWTKA